VDVAVEHDHLEILGVSRDHFMGIIGLGDWAEAGSAEHRIMEDDERLFDALGLGFVQPLPQLRHLLCVDWPIAVPQRGRPVIVFTGPQEDKPDVLEVELVDQRSGVTPKFFRYGTAARVPSIFGSPHTS